LHVCRKYTESVPAESAATAIVVEVAVVSGPAVFEPPARDNSLLQEMIEKHNNEISSMKLPDWIALRIMSHLIG
jgi:hypothetical protein